MTRTERIARAKRVQGAWAIVRAHGTAAQVERGAYYSAHGRTDAVLTLAAAVAAATSRNTYALASA